MTVHPKPNQILTFAYDYSPEASFQVVTRLPQAVVNQILGHQVNGEPVVVDTADYDAYLASYRSRGDPAEYLLVFVDGALRDGQQYAFTTDAVVFANRLNLIEARLSADEGTATTEEDGGNGGSDGGR